MIALTPPISGAKCSAGVAEESFPMSMKFAMDRALFATVTRGWSRDLVAGYVDRLKVDDEESEHPTVIGRTFQIIDMKASGLLTHTSMMIAALGVSGPAVAESRFEQGVIIVEILLYLMVALGCLRCIAIFNEHAVPHGPGVVTDAVRNELILRRELYMLCNRVAIYLTMAIFVTLPVLYFIHPAIKLGPP
jgi:hypothetical protein